MRNADALIGHSYLYRFVRSFGLCSRYRVISSFAKEQLQTYWMLLPIIFVALLLRVVVRCFSGSADFWDNGYTFYFHIAHDIAAGRGISDIPFDAGRVPLYPMFLAAVTFGQKSFLSVVVAQSLVGAGTVVCAALLAGEMFGRSAAITAGAITAVYPYYVVHDTALQETSLYTLFTALAVLVLLRTRRSGSGVTAACAGLTLGAAVLTRSSLAPFAFLAPLWLAIPGVFRAGRWRQACWAAVICGGAAALILSPWLIWSFRLTGPLTSQQPGYRLWIGNNPYTFSHYPYESIDRSRDAAHEALRPQDIRELEALHTTGAGVDPWFRQKGLEYIREHPSLAFGNALGKLGAAFGWLPSPRKSFWPNLVHSLAYGAVMTLGLWGMWSGRRHWREHLVFYALFASFAVTTAVFWGHTSHRAYLDVYWIVFAAGVLQQFHRSNFTRTTGFAYN
jgi:4-amino-4-deoxy-L-arabinose transferase-like glycosyltransferase